MKKLLIATHNLGKVREFKEILEPKGIHVTSAAEHLLPEPKETGTTFEENALIKARAACEATGLPALADDSGLCVEALDGAPGIYSARWANGSKDFDLAMNRIQTELGDSKNRRASFVCVLAMVKPDGTEKIFEGRCDGALVWPIRGAGGFGYDPMFQPEGGTLTFAEMPKEEKHELSHRARAIQAFLKSL